MQPDERDAGYLLDMLEHARGIVRVLEGRSLDDYLRDEDLRLIVERRLEIIGEAARRVSESFRNAHPEVPGGRSLRSGMSWRTSTARYRTTSCGG